LIFTALTSPQSELKTRGGSGKKDCTRLDMLAPNKYTLLEETPATLAASASLGILRFYNLLSLNEYFYR
jgi:hypothetical protein